MRKALSDVALMFSSFFLFISCVTTGLPREIYGRQFAFHEIPPRSMIGSSSDDVVDIQVGILKYNEALVTIRNKSNSMINFEWDRCSYITSSGENHRLVHTGIKFVDVNKEQVSTTIAPNSKYTDIIISSDAVHYRSGQGSGWEVSNWIEIPSDQKAKSRFFFVYSHNNELRSLFAEIYWDESEEFIEEPEESEPVFIETMETSKLFWHILFLALPDNERKTLYTELERSAKWIHGSNIIIQNEEYIPEWHPLSLLIMLSIYGWVEKATIRADIYRVQETAE